jgi:hypothetical protein
MSYEPYGYSVIFMKKTEKTADFFSKREIFTRILVGIPHTKVVFVFSKD